MNDTAVSAEIVALRALLETTPRRRRLSPALRRDFRRYLVEQGLQLNRDGLWMTLVLAPVVYLTLHGLLRLLSTPGHLADNLHVLNLAFAGGLVFSAIVVLMKHLPASRTLYPAYLLTALSGLITIACTATAAISDPYIQSLSGHVTCIVILVVYSLGVFDTRLSFLAAIIGLLAALLLSRELDLWLDAGAFMGYAVLPTVVGLVISRVTELRDCTSFLQSRLLAEEKLIIDRYATEVESLSRRDALTGLANRRHFNESLTRDWQAARRQQREISLLFVDVDHFKAYNDTYGHPAGDLVLSAIGAALARCTRRPSDLAARYGGEEFVVMLPDTSIDGARALAQDIAAEVAALSIPHSASSTAPHVTLSIGIASAIPSGTQDARSLLADADAAVYAAKRAGRNHICGAG